MLDGLRRLHVVNIRDLKSKRIECDEIWSFCYAKQKNVATAKAAPDGAGDVWTWTAIDSDSKLMVSYLGRHQRCRMRISLYGRFKRSSC